MLWLHPGMLQCSLLYFIFFSPLYIEKLLKDALFRSHLTFSNGTVVHNYVQALSTSLHSNFPADYTLSAFLSYSENKSYCKILPVISQ